MKIIHCHNVSMGNYAESRRVFLESREKESEASLASKISEKNETLEKIKKDIDELITGLMKDFGEAEKTNVKKAENFIRAMEIETQKKFSIEQRRELAKDGEYVTYYSAFGHDFRLRIKRDGNTQVSMKRQS